MRASSRCGKKPACSEIIPAAGKTSGPRQTLIAALAFIRPPETSDEDTKFLPRFDLIRRTVIYVQSEALPLAEAPIARDLGGTAAAGADAGDDAIGENDTTVMLGGLHQGLEPG